MALRRNQHSAESLASGLSFLLRAASNSDIDDLRSVAQDTAVFDMPRAA